jgi:phosphomannomutase
MTVPASPRLGSPAADPELERQVAAWINDDPEPADVKELGRVVAQGDLTQLRSRFQGRLAFGTAGLRGQMRAGPNGMNRAVVRRSAAGLAAFLGPGRTVVVGYDARHHSRQFAEDTVRILSGAGLAAQVMPRALPTPVLAFGVRHLHADAGVMITASHNPARDNGMKIYLGGPGDEGAQLIPPADHAIESAIAAQGRVSDLRLGDLGPTVDESVITAYVAATAALSLVADRDVRVAYSPLHGVGRDPLLAVFSRAGLSAPTVEPAQSDPDPDFPTVAFPNPEEPGVMDRVIALAAQTGADVAIANDPDADRCAVAVGGRCLRGNELGILLADHVLAHRPGLVATTVASSTMLARLASARGVPYAETLTGFKWLMRSGPGLVYGYEEALGYSVGPDVVRDKDGISAALLVAELTAQLRASGRTLLDRLDELERELGVHATDAYALRVDDLARIPALMNRLRAQPPRALGEHPVTEVRDLLVDSGQLPPSDILIFELHGARVVIRPSGTEPKLKAYLEAVVPVTGDLAAARTEAGRTLRELRQAVVVALTP